MNGRFSKPFWEEIKANDLKDGDVIYIQYEGYSSYDHYRIINGKWFNIFEDKFSDYFKPSDKVPYSIYKQNYRFLSKSGEWFREGTEAFLESDAWGNDESGYCACFRGWHEDQTTGNIGEDGEICPFDEFDIDELL